MNMLISSVLLMLVLVMVVGALVFYALRTKGDVDTSFSFRSFGFTLKAKDKQRNVS